MAAPLDGPRAGSSRPRQLVVLLHGYGANGRDLVALGQQWAKLLPDAAIAAPNAPDPCPGAPGGRQWFPLTSRDPRERWTGVNEAQPALDAFLDAELARHQLGDSQLALVGFSQGTMMALHVGLRRRRAPVAIVGFSGLLVGPEHLRGDLAGGRTNGGLIPPHVLLTHGSEDEVIPADALFNSAEELAGAGVPCQWHLSVGIAHSIDEAALSHAGLFLARAFGLKAGSGPVVKPAGTSC